jgi:tRNA pseudouridine38-40 synthase
MRTLDELNIFEAVSNPYFPTITERRQTNLTLEDLHARSNKSESDLSPSSISIDDRARGLNGGTDLGFGIRRRHRCFVVTARARSFLYHQVCCLFHMLLQFTSCLYTVFLNSLLWLIVLCKLVFIWT